MAWRLAQAVRANLERADDALFFDRDWLGWRWMGQVAAALDRAAGGAPCVGLVARNRPAHVAAFAANLVAGRTTSMIASAQSPAALAAELRARRLPVVFADPQDWSSEVLEAAEAAGTDAVFMLHDAVWTVRAPRRRDAACGPEVAFELLSSGTTGPPKRTPLGWEALALAVEDAGAAYAGATGEAAQILTHPLGSVAGLAYVVPALVYGRRLVLMDRFEPCAWAQAVSRHRPTRGTVPPAGVRMLLDAAVPRDQLSSLTLLAVGGGKLDPELQARFEAVYGVPVLPAFGATEFGGVVANWSLDLHRRWGEAKRGSAGRASRNVELRVVDPDSFAVLPAGRTGLLEVKAARIGPDWVRATDLASLDADGFLWLHGRADGAINRGGFKVVPDQVAAVLREHPDVADAAVVGLADARLGEVPVAAVEPVAGARLDADALHAWLRDRLLAYQTPVEVRIVDALPRNASLKVSLPQVKALFA
jgi:acyl-coenzyme A synthetase/AMP-(fatty) acid ligase